VLKIIIPKLKSVIAWKKSIKDDKVFQLGKPPSNHKATGLKLPHPLVLTETQFREAAVRIRSANPKVRV
jgi:hypothetical protein